MLNILPFYKASIRCQSSSSCGDSTTIVDPGTISSPSSNVPSSDVELGYEPLILDGYDVLYMDQINRLLPIVGYALDATIVKGVG
ncbi:hypothetical protein M5689_023627 [Euphorbia peplus]|nr:hypothetical protein M5689_023627 [Euphorbia peplus]